MTQPPYPQHPPGGGYPPQPYPAGPPGYGMPPKPPSGGTAIAAGVLAVLGGLWSLYLLIDTIVLLARGEAPLPVWNYSMVVVLAAEVGLLLGGGIMLFVKKSAGRIMVAIGSGLVLLSYVAGIVVGALGVADAGGTITGVQFGGAIAGLLILGAPPIATLVLALVPPTKRYLNQPPRPMGHPQPRW
ncbi:hypothetical protein [Amycolatopsis sp. YIM 10]|uniref:hypothetical protein n=1 Tax=Amycolatopsis sp. YIM 10 TaxID=2653857 RepID=UPI0012903323|nr:hypothetical protein [Amycolatopsis sp. YIM 10]